ncbi:phosphatase PAP2 family protein [Halobacillus amylolyticus]|uniref:Phosphatase PAP2 family protein n=1 Tax=Halobacillus amylolyticus TaxID=2932259 RepID=A0ABY4HF45_9BACI|nr:phosphatase PAP2 family protein [Halobacillus amylolyticus]UOR13364.1 phosphatase PAP2 family protein [Halobacillus amylolyticus]
MLFSGTRLSDLPRIAIILIIAGFISVGSAFFIFIEIAEDVMEKEKFAADQIATDLVNTISTGQLSIVVGWITEAGAVPIITVASIVLAIYLLFFSSFSAWVTVYFGVNMIGISLLTKGLKLMFERQRPDTLVQYDGTGFSFPSGHTTGAATFYGFLIYLTVISPLDKRWKWPINILLATVILLVALSRVYLGVHFFTDIIAGLLLGLSWLFICIGALELTIWRQRRRQRKSVG